MNGRIISMLGCVPRNNPKYRWPWENPQSGQETSDLEKKERACEELNDPPVERAPDGIHQSLLDRS